MIANCATLPFPPPPIPAVGSINRATPDALTKKKKTSDSVALSSPVFFDSKDDFPIFATTHDQASESTNWQSVAANLYNLPHRVSTINSSEFDTLKLETNPYKYPCASFRELIRTKNIFRDSERFYGLDLTGFARSGMNDIRAKADRLPKTIASKERLRRALTRSANQLYYENRDFPLKDNLTNKLRELVPYDLAKKRFTKKDAGFKYALRVYFNNLKNYQPYLYRLCYLAAKELAKSNSGERLQGICSISVHQSETNLPNLLLELSKQKFDKSKCPIFLFVNGNDKGKIQARLDEIEKFKTTVDPDLDLRVISAQLDTWRFGLKSIPYITALMTVAMHATDDDSDLASLFFDADILRFANDKHISHYVGAINDGWVRAASYFEDDLDYLKKRNFNYYLLHLMSDIADVIGDRGQKKQLDIDDYKLTRDGIGCSGGDTGFSTIVNLLCGATSAHVNNEDSDWSTRATSQLAKAYSDHFGEHADFYNAISVPNSLGCGIIHDGGHLVRIANTGRSVLDVWNSHDEIQGGLSPISDDFHGVNHLRFVEELTLFFKQVLANTVITLKSDEATIDEHYGHQIIYLALQIVSLRAQLKATLMDIYPQLCENKLTIAINRNNADEVTVFLQNKYMPDRIYKITHNNVVLVEEIPTRGNSDFDIIDEESTSFDYTDLERNPITPTGVGNYDIRPSPLSNKSTGNNRQNSTT